MCECEQIHQWGPDNWHGDDDISTWKQYLSLRGIVDYAIGEHINHVCRTHYRRIFELKSIRQCITCRSKQSSKWRLVCNITDSPEKICEAFSLELASVHFFDWICDQCCLCYANDERLETEITNTAQSQDQLTAERSSLLLRALDTLKNDGVIFTKEIRSEFREILFNLDIDSTQHARLCNTLTKYLSNLTILGWWKPKHTDQYLHFESYHHPRIKSGIMTCLRTRAERVCKGANVAEEKEHLCKVFIANGYDQEVSQQSCKSQEQRR